jgi:dihydroorotate dehydrogenase (NAD+) catalytic subunit
MLNAVGLQNPGIDAVIANEVPNIAEIFQGPVIANVGGFSLEEYADNCRKLNGVDQVKILEVNISCPNVHAGGQNFGSDPQGAAAVTKAVRAVTDKPVFMKLSPNVTDIAAIARACEAEGADASASSTLLGMRIDLKTKRPLLQTARGLSGPAVFPLAVRMVWDVYEAVKPAHIGCGGVSSAEDVCEMMLDGATPWRWRANTSGILHCKTSSKNCPLSVRSWA